MEAVNNSSRSNYKHGGEDDDAAVLALAACGSSILQMVLTAAVELDLFEIIAGAGDGARLSPSDIVSRLPTAVDRAAVVLESMMKVLAAHSLLTCENGGGRERRYGISPAGKFFVNDEGGASLRQYLLFSPQGASTGPSLKDIVLGGGNISEKLFGKSFYEQMESNVELSKKFNEAMGSHSAVLMKKVVKTYRGFEGLSCLVDVGGGTGTALATIISNNPSIRGINFDLPHIVKTASPYNGIEHIGGDMFVQVPKGDAILLKFILHNWGDEECGNLLKCCYKSLPKEKGKMIVMDYIMPNTPQTDIHAMYASQMDFTMTALLGGKERTEDEFQALAINAGFRAFKVVSYVYGMWIMEFIK
ncbi:hypothetical protein ABFS83_07G073400 [Erythranthe nasuta]